MLIQQRAQQKDNRYQKTVLYRYVFDSYFVKFAAFMLFAFLLLQPFTMVYAASVDNATTTEQVLHPEIINSVAIQDQLVHSATSSATLITLPVITESSVVKNMQDATSTHNIASSTLLAIGSHTDTTLHSSTTNFISISSSTTNTPAPSGTSNTAQNSVSSSTSFKTATQTQQKVPISNIHVVNASTSTSTQISTSTAQTKAVTIHNSAAFQFDTSQCAVVGKGAYYCNDTKATTSQVQDGVFSAPDSDGDMEIYVRVHGEQSQITHNTTDDSAPYYDAVSKRIVWQSIVNDRYQIISYDLETGKQTRLTDTAYNNMEPVAYGNITLWQAWIDNNWEIMMYDGHVLQQLTNNTLQDVSPHMREGYIVWQTQFKDGWQVAVYNQETKVIQYIPSEGGLKVENPRFVLVYDSTDQHGDKKTLGYDFSSKTSFNLGRLPEKVPEKLPNPDQTGETRALIQNKQSSKENDTELLDIVHNPTASGSTTPQNTNTLDVTHATSSLSMGTSTITNKVDVVIQNYVATSSANKVQNIQSDLVIPPFVATTTQEVS